MSDQSVTRLFIIRHAETDKNTVKLKGARKPYKGGSTPEEDKDKLDSKSLSDLSSSLLFEKNCKLNYKGKIQAGILADYFGSIEHKISAIYTSPLIRAIETADAIFKRIAGDDDIDFVTEERLFCGKNNKSAGESNLKDDVEQLIREIAETYVGYDVLLVTHNHIFNIVYKLFSNSVDTIDQAKIAGSLGSSEKIKVDNCSMSCIEFSKNKCRISYWAKKVKVTYTLV
jgi:broad specificity phosphatase PhoE